MYRAILWDVDGTLLDFHRTMCAAIKECFRICGIGECTDSMAERYHEINQSWWERLER